MVIAHTVGDNWRVIETERLYQRAISKEDKDSNSYYSVVFSKYEEGYPYYSEKLIMNINKESGKLQGCINKTQNLSHKKVDINISEKEAEEIVLNSFNKLNKDGKIINKPNLAFYNNKEDEGENETGYIDDSGVSHLLIGSRVLENDLEGQACNLQDYADEPRDGIGPEDGVVLWLVDEYPEENQQYDHFGRGRQQLDELRVGDEDRDEFQ